MAGKLPPFPTQSRLWELPTLRLTDGACQRLAVEPFRAGAEVLLNFSRFLSEDTNQLILFDIQLDGTGVFSPSIVLILERLGADHPGTMAKRHPFR